MKNTMRLYPLLFEPNLHTVIWGGHRLRPYKGMEPSQEKVGESWEVSAVPSSINVISNGELRGCDLVSVISEAPEAILGKAVAEKYNGCLPLLAKFIDAEKDLSIQVHPNDEMAAKVHGKFGKTEMWYVIDATPGSFLYAGFNREITKEEYKRRIEDGTITDVLAKHHVVAGDVFYIPAGRVHAICGGILLAEIQQSSDVTYRMYDYNRPGLDGKPRELHTELAAEALDFHVENEYRTQYSEELNHSNQVIVSPYFNVRVTELTRPFHRNLVKYDSFVISMCIEGDCKIQMRGTVDSALQEIMLKEGHSCLIPAEIADYDVVPLNGKTRILDAFIDNKDRSIGAMVNRLLHLSKK